MLEPEDLIDLQDFEWTDDFSYHRKLTCINHQNLRWSTKNFWARSIFYVSEEEGHECSCGMGDLRVIVSQSQDPRKG